MSVTSDRRPYGRSLVPVLAGLTAIGPATSDIYLPAFPEIAADLNVGASGVQLTLTANFVGLALGQLLIGPLSDRYGRRKPLVIGMALFALASLGCAVAPNLAVLLVGRLVQGLAGGAGPVVSRAVVRDLFSGVRFTQFFAQLMLVFGVAPIAAPLLGTALLRLGGWRVIFVALAVFGAVLMLCVIFFFRETLPRQRRTSGGVTGTLRTMRVLLRDRDFLAYSLGSAFAIAAMFSYIGGFSFVAQDVYGTSPTVFAVLFGVNAAGFIAAGQVSARLAAHVPQRRLVLYAAAAQAAAGVLLAVLVVADRRGASTLGLVGLELGLFVVVASLGFLMPCATALAMAEHHAVAGTAAAAMGTLQLGIGGLAAPLVGLAGSDSAVPFGIVIAVLALIALGLLTRTSPAEPVTAPEDEVVAPQA